MFGARRWIIAFDKRLQAAEMRAIERLSAADRQADAMDREGRISAQTHRAARAEPAGAHVILGVDFEKSDIARRGYDVREMRALETDASASGQRGGCVLAAMFGGGTRAHAWPQCEIGSRLPLPLGVTIDVHVPFGTYFHASP